MLRELHSQIELLTIKLETCADDKQKREITSDLVRLRSTEKALNGKKLYGLKLRKKAAPLPRSYIERRNEEREKFASISGRKKSGLISFKEARQEAAAAANDGHGAACK